MNINWYPGHMKVAFDNFKKNLKLIDIVVELIDARIPFSSKNPKIDEILENKPSVLLFNKIDLADEYTTKKWKEYYESIGKKVLLVNANQNKGLNNLRQILEDELSEKFKRDEQKLIKDKTIKMMMVGIPNVGKSTLINTLSKRTGAKVGNLPGVTRNIQWIKTPGKIELLDTPGVLWPKFENKEIGLNLAFVGSIDDDILDVENLSYELIKKLNKIDPNILKNRYNIEFDLDTDIAYIMDMIGERRGAILKKGIIDYDKVSRMILREFRLGKLGRISLEKVSDFFG
ncbi:ribosome biogenesis GTPase YlqF [Citroniella saccharovorans]|uniref:Ribosome biogenesis GTPase A n=1 Tax=Citroniella saccharovorans TaxID=2053367 RepID=A0AAW9MYB2_9FIRM|nr:ribosome biogenesis GTPase YlqF [Citroniella saccharovorans]MEB3429479.1 ribosome biogenesis GTPase YlqF [Citroniella saccharovorans]